jgi:hypothetical protein
MRSRCPNYIDFAGLQIHSSFGSCKNSLMCPECLEDWVSEDNAVKVIEAFVEALDLHGMGFERVIAKRRAGSPTIRQSS